MFRLRKKKWMSWISFLLALLVQLSVLTPFPVRAQASDTGDSGSFPFITGITLTDTTTNKVLGGTDVTGVSKDDYVSIRYDFSIPNGTDVAAGTIYTFQIPDQIQLVFPNNADSTTQELDDSDGTKVATVVIGKDGSGTITFADYAATHADVGGTFEITGQFNSDNIGNTTPVEIPFTVQGQTTPINVYFSQPDASGKKSGSYDAASGEVTWTVQLNANHTTITDGEFTDAIAPGAGTPDKSQTYVAGSFKLTDSDSQATVYDSGSETGNTGTFAYTAAPGDASKTGTLDYHFSGSTSDAYTVTYRTKINDPSQYFGGAISNKATLTTGGKTLPAISGTVDIPTPDYITKSGVPSADGKTIDWTVHFNNDGYSLHGVTVTDPLPEGLTLTAGSVKVNGSTVNPGTSTGEFSYTGGTLVYYAGDIQAAQTLTFSTDLPANYWQQNHSGTQFENTATMKSENDNSYLTKGADSNTAGVGIENSVIEKSSSYDSETHTIQWTITVNAAKQDLADAQISDTIPAGQELLTDTYTVKDSSGHTVTTAPAFTLPADPGTADTQFTDDLGPITDFYTITYTTQLTDQTVWAGNRNVDYTNKVTLNPGGGMPSSSVTATQNVNPTVIGKAAAGYNYTTHEITWQITVNQSELPLTGAVVTDVLQSTAQTPGLSDFDLETDSIQVDSKSIGTDPGSTPYYTYTADSRTLQVHLGDLNGDDKADRTKTITFKTKLNKADGSDAYDTYFNSNGNHDVTNIASLVTNQNSTAVDSAPATQTIQNKLVEKKSYYNTGNAYIDWAVEIDQNQVSLDNLKLTDVLQEGLELDTSSVKLYKQTLGDTGSLTPAPVYSGGNLTVAGTPETLTKDNISYDASTRTFTFTMPSSVSQPYVLTFRTTVADTVQSGTKFSNTISFAGGDSGQQSTSSNVTASFSSSSGSAWGTTGSVTVKKADAAGGAPLAGAVFGLYDQYGNLIRLSSPTGSDGNAKFDHLQFGVTYTVSEYTAPGNYEKSQDAYTFQLKSGGNIQLLDASGNPAGSPQSGPLTLKDTRKTAAVTFRKTGDGNQPLAGAVFTLCDGSGAPVSGFQTVTTGADGIVTFANVPYGQYQIKETAAPAGYLPLTVSVTLDDQNTDIVTDGTTHTLDLGTRQDAPGGSLTVQKDGADYTGGTASALAGATFEVLDSQHNRVGQTQQTGTDGKAVFSDLPAGSYTLHEISAPSDYQTAADYPFTISAGDTPARRQLTYTVTDIKETGSIRFIKTDGQNPLPGAGFTLYDAAGKNPVRNAGGVITAVSGADGKVEFTDVPYGDYEIIETSAPANYAAMDPIRVALHDGGSGICDLGSVTDNLKNGTIRFTKTDGDRALAGAQFTLSGNGVTRTATSDQNGTVEFDNVPYSDTPYTVSETQAPAAYYQKAADFSVTLSDRTADESQTLTLADPVVDTPLGSIALTKTDAAGNPLPGAVFELYDSGNHLVQTSQASGSDGKIVFSGLPLKATGATTYTLREKTPPVNYAKTADRTVTLYNSDGQRDISGLTVADTLKAGTIRLTKVDQDGNGLNGATFSLIDPLTGQPVYMDGKPVQAVSQTVGGQTGVVLFTGVPYGTYQIRETGVPADYTAGGETLTANLTDGNPAVILNMLTIGTPVTNTVRRGEISFVKTDESGAPLAGATFALYGPGGKQVGASQVSDSQGRVTFANVPYGDGYTIRETAAPENYSVHAPITVNLHAARYDGGTVTDTKLTGSVTVKDTDSDGNPIPGATITIHDSDGNTVGQGVTGPDGTVTFPDLPYGTYTIEETAVPKGYKPDTRPRTVTIGAGSTTPLVQINDNQVPLGNPLTSDKARIPWAEACVLALLACSAAFSGKIHLRRRNG